MQQPRRFPWAIMITALCAGATVGGSIAHAATEDDVLARSRPDYDAKGMPLGGFRLFPTLYLGVGNDDNIYRTESGAVSDTYFQVDTNLDLQSDWNRHALNLTAGTNSWFYSDYGQEDHTNWHIGADGRLDVVRTTYLTGGANYQSLHEERSSPDLPGYAAEPTQYSLRTLDAAATWQPSRIGFYAGVVSNRYDYDSTSLVGGGVLNNDDRDRDVVTTTGKVFYEFSPGYAGYVSVSYNERSFDQTLDRSGYNRSSHGYAVDGGLRLMLSHLLEGEIYAGYLDQSYKAPLSDVDGFDYGVALTWYPSEMTTVRLNAARTLTDTTIAGASAADEQSVRLELDHELMRNVILIGNLGYADSEYSGSTRRDTLTSAGVGVRYLLNRYFTLVANYSYQSRNSNVAGQDFDNNVISAGLSLHP